jgi:hypothetical protein
MNLISAAAAGLAAGHARFDLAAKQTLKAAAGEPGASLVQGVVDMMAAEAQAKTAVGVVRATDEMLGRALDIMA